MPGTAQADGEGRNTALATTAAQMLRSRWRAASIAAGWSFPSDWSVREVDEVCNALLDGHAKRPALFDALTMLGKARAQTGAELGETLHDLAALHAAVTKAQQEQPDVDSVPAWMMRAVVLGWAEVISDLSGAIEVVDPLTGLATAAYLRTRLSEIYRGGTEAQHTLIVVTVDMSSLDCWSRSMVMILLAEVLREIFVGEQTVALLGASVAAVLTKSDAKLATRRARTRWTLANKLAVDPAFRKMPQPEIWGESLPATYQEAMTLLTRLGRAGFSGCGGE